MNTCVGEFGGGCTKENKKELLRSQAACQGILVGVCIELSQFEGTVWRLFISCYFCIHCSKGNYLLPYMDFSALLLRQRLIASCVVLGRTGFQQPWRTCTDDFMKLETIQGIMDQTERGKSKLWSQFSNSEFKIKQLQEELGLIILESF